MSTRDQALHLVQNLPEVYLRKAVAYLQGLMDANDTMDDIFCEQLLQDYLDDPDPHKHDTVTLEQLAADLGVSL